ATGNASSTCTIAVGGAQRANPGHAVGCVPDVKCGGSVRCAAMLELLPGALGERPAGTPLKDLECAHCHGNAPPGTLLGGRHLVGEGQVGGVGKDKHTVVDHLEIANVAALPAPKPKRTSFAEADGDDWCACDELLLGVAVRSHLVAERAVVPVDEHSVDALIDLDLAPCNELCQHIGEG